MLIELGKQERGARCRMARGKKKRPAFTADPSLAQSPPQEAGPKA